MSGQYGGDNGAEESESDKLSGSTAEQRANMTAPCLARGGRSRRSSARCQKPIHEIRARNAGNPSFIAFLHVYEEDLSAAPAFWHEPCIDVMRRRSSSFAQIRQGVPIVRDSNRNYIREGGIMLTTRWHPFVDFESDINRVRDEMDRAYGRYTGRRSPLAPRCGCPYT